MTDNMNFYSFDAYDVNMNPAERRQYLSEHREKLEHIIYSNLKDMTNNESKTLWRKIYGNSQSSTPLTSCLGETIKILCSEIFSMKNQKKSQLRKKTMLLNSKQAVIDNMTDSLQVKDQTLNELSAAYRALEEKINSTNTTEIAEEYDKIKEIITQAKMNQNILLESIRILSKKIRDNNIPLPLSELPHYKAGIQMLDLSLDI